MPPLERLKYFPGQRLDAVDLNLEANYELTVRRLLNKGLFTPGVVSGLEVTITGPREVTIAPGLALDIQGRELYISDPIPLAVPNQKPAGGGDTYYLLITYDEQQVPASDGGCAPSNGTKNFSRVREVPYLALTADWPNPQLCSGNFRDLNCGIFLASVTLGDSCQVASVDTGLRQYSYPAHSSQVHEASYEGEKDIAPGESKRLFFHIRGGSPHAVTLYLRGTLFSRLWYTELGHHSHSFSATSGPSTRPSIGFSHEHDVSGSGNAKTDGDGVHNHTIWTPDVSALSPTGQNVVTGTVPPLPGTGYSYNDHNINLGGGADPSWVGEVPIHRHRIALSGQKTTTQDQTSSPMDHTHSIDASNSTVGDTGVTDVGARSGLANAAITDLRVTLDTIDITQNILNQIQWTTPLGGLVFNTDAGTGGIDLLRLAPITGQPKPPDIGPGKPHVLEFSVKSGSGGKLLYNLYVE
jgi:hypothetical protein